MQCKMVNQAISMVEFPYSMNTSFPVHHIFENIALDCHGVVTESTEPCLWQDFNRDNTLPTWRYKALPKGNSERHE